MRRIVHDQTSIKLDDDAMIDLIVDFLLIPHLKHMQLLNDDTEENTSKMADVPRRLHKYEKETLSKVLQSYHKPALPENDTGRHPRSDENPEDVPKNVQIENDRGKSYALAH